MNKVPTLQQHVHMKADTDSNQIPLFLTLSIVQKKLVLTGLGKFFIQWERSRGLLTQYLTCWFITVMCRPALMPEWEICLFLHVKTGRFSCKSEQCLCPCSKWAINEKWMSANTKLSQYTACGDVIGLCDNEVVTETANRGQKRLNALWVYKIIQVIIQYLMVQQQVTAFIPQSNRGELTALFCPGHHYYLLL